MVTQKKTMVFTMYNISYHTAMWFWFSSYFNGNIIITFEIDPSLVEFTFTFPDNIVIDLRLILAHLESMGEFLQCQQQVLDA